MSSPLEKKLDVDREDKEEAVLRAVGLSIEPLTFAIVGSGDCFESDCTAVRL